MPPPPESLDPPPIDERRRAARCLMDAAFISLSADVTQKKATASFGHEQTLNANVPTLLRFHCTAAGSEYSKAVYADLEKQVEAWVERPDVWSRIEAVAEALQARDVLTGDDIAGILALAA
jgi:hypothetical protein